MKMPPLSCSGSAYGRITRSSTTSAVAFCSPMVTPDTVAADLRAMLPPVLQDAKVSPKVSISF